MRRNWRPRDPRTGRFIKRESWKRRLRRRRQRREAGRQVILIPRRNPAIGGFRRFTLTIHAMPRRGRLRIDGFWEMVVVDPLQSPEATGLRKGRRLPARPISDMGFLTRAEAFKLVYADAVMEKDRWMARQRGAIRPDRFVGFAAVMPEAQNRGKRVARRR